jgi:hypothetical protein
MRQRQTGRDKTMTGRLEILARKMGLAKDRGDAEQPKGYGHNYGGSDKGYYCTPFFDIDVGLDEPIIMALEFFDAERGTVNRQPFGKGMCNGRVANWMEKDKATGRFMSKAKEIEVWH